MKIGSFELLEVGYLCDVFGIARRTAFYWLKTLQITILNVGDRAYFPPESLEITLRVITEAGGVFSMPGSSKKNNGTRESGRVVLSDKMKKRVCTVQTHITDNFNEKVKQWQKEKEELKQAKQKLRELRKVIKDAGLGV